MRRVCYKEMDKVEKEWRALYADNKLANPYLEYEFSRMAGRSSGTKNILAFMRYRELNAVLYKNDKAMAILPLIMEKKGQMLEVNLRGYYIGAGHLGILCSEECRYDDFCFLFEELQGFLRGKAQKVKYKFYRLRENSILQVWLSRYLAENNIEYTRKEQKCATIHIADGREVWYSGLSKSMRQNIRTSYNHLTTDGVEMKIKIYDGRKMEVDDYKKVVELYSKRIAEKRRKKILPDKLMGHVLFVLKYKNKMMRALDCGENNFHILLYLNEELGAYLSGFKSNDRKVIVPHFSYNTEQNRYAPGYILINEAISELSRKDFLELDLSCGDESYKYRLGGEEYYNYHYEFIS